MRPFRVRRFFNTHGAIVDNRPVAAFHVEQRVVQAVGDRTETENALDGARGRGDVHFARRVLHRLCRCIHLYSTSVKRKRKGNVCSRRLGLLRVCDVSSPESNIETIWCI